MQARRDPRLEQPVEGGQVEGEPGAERHVPPPRKGPIPIADVGVARCDLKGDGREARRHEIQVESGRRAEADLGVQLGVEQYSGAAGEVQPPQVQHDLTGERPVGASVLLGDQVVGIEHDRLELGIGVRRVVHWERRILRPATVRSRAGRQEDEQSYEGSAPFHIAYSRA